MRKMLAEGPEERKLCIREPRGWNIETEEERERERVTN